MIGGSLKLWRSGGWSCIRFLLFIKTSFIEDTEGWYCVTKSNISFSSLLFFSGVQSPFVWILFLIVRSLSKYVGNLWSNIFVKRCF